MQMDTNAGWRLRLMPAARFSSIDEAQTVDGTHNDCSVSGKSHGESLLRTTSVPFFLSRKAKLSSCTCCWRGGRPWYRRVLCCLWLCSQASRLVTRV